MIFAPGTTVGGRYKLKEELAKGGMGSVWVARHLQLEVDVAIKFMDPETVSSAVARGRFEREAKASAQLQHPHIVHVHDFGFEGNTPFLVMELLRGENLEERLKRERRLSLQATAVVLIQVAKGLRKAHEAGFVHRDLKPGNIFISGSEDEEIVKILDFGIAKQTGSVRDSTSTKTGEFMGSPHYMSPEQIQSVKDIDGRSDLWSLGVILYRMITGDHAFAGDTVGAVIGNVFSAPIPRPSHVLPGLPNGIDEFFKKVLARDRTQRFQTVREVTDAFMQLAGPATPGAFMGSRDSGSLWQAQRAAPVDRKDAEELEAEKRVMQPNLMSGAADADRQDRISEPTPAVGGASLRAVGPKQRGGRTMKLPLPTGGLAQSAPPAALQSAGLGPRQQSAPQDSPMMAAGTLTVSPSTDQTVSSESGRRSAPGDAPKKSFLESRGPLVVGLLMAVTVLVLLALFIMLRSPVQNGASPAEATSISAAIAGIGVPVPSTSAVNGPVEIGLPADDKAQAVTPDQQVDRGRSAAPFPKAFPESKIPSGQARLSITAKGGSCTITINLANLGSTPLNPLVQPGTTSVFCRKPSGVTRQVVFAVEGETTYVVFDLRPKNPPSKPRAR